MTHLMMLSEISHSLPCLTQRDLFVLQPIVEVNDMRLYQCRSRLAILSRHSLHLILLFFLLPQGGLIRLGQYLWCMV